MKLATRWTGYAAAAWAALFTLLSFYWAAGGTAAAETIGDVIASIMILWGGSLWIQHRGEGLEENGRLQERDHSGLTCKGGSVLALALVGATRYFQTQARASEVPHQPRTGVSASE